LFRFSKAETLATLENEEAQLHNASEYLRGFFVVGLKKICPTPCQRILRGP
jgi:hypothetical protein